MNKTEQVYSELRKRIESGEFPCGSRFPSEYRLAEEYGIDKKTANAAAAQLVSEGFLKRGLRGAGTTVVKQNIFPRGYLAFAGSFSLYNARILNGIQQTALGAGYAVSVIFSDEAQLRLHLEALNSSCVKGVIAAGYAGLLTQTLRLPVVRVDLDVTTWLKGAYVNTDNRRGACELMSEVLRRGHRNILIYCGGRQFQVRQDRLAGFSDALKERGAAAHTLYGSAGSSDDARSFLRKMRSAYPKTTIVVCDGDDTAQSLFAAALDEGIPVPQQLCITSYGNTLTPGVPAASVEQYPEKIGAIACSKLIDSIESGAMPLPGIEFVKPDLTGVRFITDLADSGR